MDRPRPQPHRDASRLAHIWLIMRLKLRDQIQIQPVQHQNRPMWLLSDSWQLTPQQLMLPYPLARLVSQFDGHTPLSHIQRSVSAELGAAIPRSVIEQMIDQLDEACFLENATSAIELTKKITNYRSQPYRPPMLAGHSYPASADQLHAFLEKYSANDHTLKQWQGWQGRGIISPHIDYQRGGKIYAQTWQRAKQAIESAELILIFATDHKSSYPSITLSHLPYATPYGVLPTDPELVQQLATVIGEKLAFDLELNHIQEHSIELVVTWLHHLRRENPCPVVPILVGSFHQFTPHGHPDSDPLFPHFIAKLQELTANKKLLAVASADFSHVGPAFDTPAVDARYRQQVTQSDADLRAAICRGDAEAFYQQIAPHRNQHNVCGFSPIYMLMRYLGRTHGIDVGYDQCSADAQNSSIVTIGGLLLE